MQPKIITYEVLISWCRMWVQQCNEICCNQTDRRFKLNLIFTAWCVCIARTMPWQDVCPSVCLSHTSIVPKRLHISSQFFHRRVAPPFQFFHTKRDSNIPTGTPLMGASNARGYDKMTIFSQISRSISVRWAHAARQFVSIELSFHPYNI